MSVVPSSCSSSGECVGMRSKKKREVKLSPAVGHLSKDDLFVCVCGL